MMPMSEARRLDGVVLGAELNVGDEVIDLAHDQRWRVIEGPHPCEYTICTGVANRLGGPQCYPVTTPFRRAT